MHTLSSAMWIVEHPVEREMHSAREGRNNVLSYMYYLWGAEEHTVTLDSEESNPLWDRNTRFTSLEGALKGMGQQYRQNIILAMARSKAKSKKRAILPRRNMHNKRKP